MFANTQAKKVECPYCGERIEIVVDGSVEEQSYIEDCQVCCRPIQFEVVVHGDDFVEVHASGENDVY